jgi:hypothetical protein
MSEAVNLSPVFNEASYADQSGFPLAGGQIWQYQAGSDSVQQITYTDSSGDVENSNPLVLDASGRMQTGIWLSENLSYHLVLTDALGNPLVQYDNVTSSGLSFDPTSGTPTYIYGTNDGITSAAYTASTVAVGIAATANNANNAQHLRDGGTDSGGIMTFSTTEAGTVPADVWGTNNAGATNTLFTPDTWPVSTFPNDVGYAPLASPAFTGVPTAPTATTTDNSTTLATTAFVHAAVAGGGGSALLANNGYFMLPSGLIFQWGQTGVITQDTEIHVTFPIPFTTAIFAGFATCNYDGDDVRTADNLGQIRALTKTGMFVCRAACYHSTGGPGNNYWSAIGY